MESHREKSDAQSSAKASTATPSTQRPTVVVTGSSGLIGTRICRDLRRDYEVVGLDRDDPAETTSAEPERPHTWIPCDLTDDDSVRAAGERLRAERGEHIASVVHLAAYYDFSGEPSPLYDELTLEGTRRVLDVLEGFDVEQLVFSSSLLVMKAVSEGEVLTEESEELAEWDYPRSKLETERLIHQRDACPTVILRLAGVYDEKGHSVPLTQQIARIHQKELESYLFPGNPRHGQSFVHLDDAVAAVRAAVDRRDELERFETFLIGEPEVVSYGEIQDIVGEELHGSEWPTIRIPAPLAKAGAWLQDKFPGQESFIKPWMIDLADAHMPVSPGRAERKLGWRPRHRLRDVLPAMTRSLLADPRAWYEENGIDVPKQESSRA